MEKNLTPQELQDGLVINFYDEATEVEALITVQRANLVAGVRRTRLQQQAKILAEGKNWDVDEWITCTSLWPDVGACSSGKLRLADGTEMAWPLDYEAFRVLPDDLALAVVDAVYRINPHWVEKPAEEPAAVVAEKKLFDELIIWLARFESAEKPDTSLPELVELNDEALAKRVYLVEEMFADADGSWRFLPSALLEEDEALMDDLMTLRWLAGKLRGANKNG